MAVSERRRSQLYERLVATIGDDEAGTMFELLPPPSTDIATTADIDRLDGRITTLGQRMDDRFVAVDARFVAVDARFDAMDARFDAMDARFDDLGQRFDDRLDDRIDGLRHELTAVFHRELSALYDRFASQTRTLTLAAVSTALTITGAAIALSRLL